MFFDYGFMVYAAIIIAILVQIFLKRTNRGLNLRSVGESPATADAAGINVTRYKYLATCIGGGITGLGGVYYVMDYIKGTWANDGTIENLGWLAVALVIFATWKPTRTIWGSYLFGIFFWAYLLIASRIDKAVTGVVQDAALYRYNNRTHYCFAAQEKGGSAPGSPRPVLFP